MMKAKKKFESPRVLGELPMSPAGVLLGSLADRVTIETTGQKVENYDFSHNEFNHEWTE